MLVILTMVLQLFAIPTLASSDVVETEGLSGIQTICEALSRSVEAREGVELEIADTKLLYDFAGNAYFLTEYAPTGYMIAHADTQEVVEYALASDSPYLGLDSDLFYGGATYYYYFNGDEYVHTIISESISVDEAQTFAEVNQKMNDCLYTAALNDTADLSNSTAAVTKTYVPGSSFLSTLSSSDSFGYYAGGVCGYIASGMLLLWMTKRYNTEYINRFTFLKAGNRFRNGNFTRKLRYEYGYGNDSSADGTFASASMKDVLLSYASDIKASFTIKTNPPLTLPTASSIIKILKESQVPVVVFGDLNYPSGDDSAPHAVLAYGYTSDNDVVVHYGWSGYANVVLSYNWGVLGSILYITNNSLNTVTIEDIPNDNWAYEPVSYCIRYGIIDVWDRGIKNFLPNEYMARGAFVNALYQFAGCPDISAYNAQKMYDTFDDFDKNTRFHDAAVWAYYNDLLYGTTNMTLTLGGAITREQAVVFLYRFSNSMNYSFSNTNGPAYTTFQDASKVTGYGIPAMDWATRRYIIWGSNNKLSPHDTMTRAQCASMLYCLAVRATP